MENVAHAETLAGTDVNAISQLPVTSVFVEVANSVSTDVARHVAGLLTQAESEPVPTDAVDLLWLARSGIADLAAAKQSYIDNLPTEYRMQIQQFDDDIRILQDRFAPLEDTLKLKAMLNKKTIKGSLAQMVFANGRVSYDSKALDAYAVANPDVLRFRKEGNPSISLRAVGGAK